MPDSAVGPTRVLVVDDERMIADTSVLILNASGFEAKAAYSGEEALVAAREFRPDIVLSDHWMPPGMTGLEACRQILQMLPGCRIIMLSGQSLGKEFAVYQSKGYDFILLAKPVHPADLVKIVSNEKVAPLSSEEEPLRVLNVDDVEEHRYSVTRLLRRAGFDVHEAASAAEGISKAREVKPDLMLLDINLPDGNGFDVCATLKKDPETGIFPVIHVTNSDKSPEAAERSAQAGAEEYIPYPVVPNHLVKRVREVLQLRLLREELSRTVNEQSAQR